MKKRIKYTYFFLCIISVMLFSYLLIYSTNENKVIESGKKSNIKVNSNFLTMMYETEYQSGEYTIATDSTWPQEGYTFNETLSKCENGSKLTWDDENKRVVMQANRSDRCFLYFDKSPVTLASYIINNVYTGIDGENGLYYHDGVGTYTNADKEAGDNSYRYAGGDYQLTSTAINAGYTNIYVTSSTATDGIINFYCNDVKQYIGDVCSSDTTYFTTAYNESIHYSTLLEVLTEAVNAGYLTMDNVNNFVCFGSDVKNCSINNLYRIIGVFDGQVKLIKYDYATSEMLGNPNLVLETGRGYRGFNKTGEAYLQFYPDGSGLLQLLNNNYISFLGENLSDMISYHIWQTTNSISDFIIEANNNLKIGLINWGDYVYSYYPIYWNSDSFSYNVSLYNSWMYMGDMSYILESMDCTGLGDVPCVGLIAHNGEIFWATDAEFHTVRPTFYLNSDVSYIFGTGTSTDPYIIG